MPGPRTRLAALLGLMLCMGGACVGRGEPVPAAIDDYLSALRDARLGEAYDLTQLSELGKGGRGGALTEEHFVAFYERNPLRGFEILEVVRLDRRDPGAMDEQGTAEWDARVRLDYGFGSVEESFGVLGEVLSQVTVVPVALNVETPDTTIDEITVDGVVTDLANAQVGKGASGKRLVVLNGRHTIRIGDVTVEFDAEPLTVLRGPATAGPADTFGNPRSLIVQM